MPHAAKFTYMTIEEYLEFEETSQIRHEYVDGRVFAMSGARRRHEIIAGNIFAKLHGFLSGSLCRPFIGNFKAHIKSPACFYYPDVMVACDKNDGDSVYTEEPVLIVEVLSPSTATIDRREKLTNYMKIPTLREYLIVHQRRIKVELYRRIDKSNWSMLEFGAGDEIVLESLPKGELTISVDSIYADAQPKGGTLTVKEEPEQYYLHPEEALALDW